MVQLLQHLSSALIFDCGLLPSAVAAVPTCENVNKQYVIDLDLMYAIDNFPSFPGCVGTLMYQPTKACQVCVGSTALFSCVSCTGLCLTHPLAERQPVARRPAAAPLGAAGPAASARPLEVPSSRSERAAPCKSAASPPGWNRSAGPGSSDSLVTQGHIIQGLKTTVWF